MNGIDFRFVPFFVKFYRKDFVTKRLVDQSTAKLVRKSKPNDKNFELQVPSNNLTFYPDCKVLVEMEFPYFWNFKNRGTDQIVPTIGIPEIGLFQK